MTYQSNIWKLYIIKATRWFLLIMPIIVPFFKASGLSMKEVMLLQSIMAFFIVVTEIPSGYLGDLFGRKWSLVAGMIFGFLGMLNMGFVSSFWGFAVTEMLLGIGASFVSGADSALLYDSLLAENKQDKFIKYQGNLSSLGSISEASAAIIGGLMAAWWIRSPVFLHSAILFLGIFVAISLKEPPRKKMKANETGQNFKKVFQFLYEHAKLKWWLLYTAIVGTGTLTTAWIIQPYLLELNIELKHFGFLWTALNLIVALGAFLSNWIYKIISIKILVIGVLIIIVVGLPLAGYAMAFYGILFFMLINFVRGVKEPILQNYINQYTDSEMRATVLSIKSFLIRGCFALFGPMVGWLLDFYSFGWAMLLTGVILSIAGIFTIVMLYKNKALIKAEN